MANPLWKYGTERIAVKDKKAKRQRFVERRTCREIVYQRDKMTCRDCTKQCKHPRECWPGDPDVAHVHEEPPRSLGGDPTNPEDCVLLCGQCHRERHEKGKR